MRKIKNTNLFLSMGAVAFMLVACNQTEENGGSTNSGNDRSDESAADVVTISHDQGETKVPTDPQRIVVLDNRALDNLTAVDANIVGAASVTVDEPFFSYLNINGDEIENIGSIDEPNLEAIATLQPDLIIGNTEAHEAIYDQLSNLAPTVFVETLALDWEDSFYLQAEAAGRLDEAKQAVAEYKERVEEVRNDLGSDLKEMEISLIRPLADQLRIYLPLSYSGEFIEEIGFPRPEAQQGEEFAREITEEQIEDADGDVIFWFERNPENFLTTELADSDLWQTLEAVQNDEVYEVSAETWLSGMGIQSRNLMLEDIREFLIKE